MLVNKENITNLIAHRSPIIMIDNLLEQNEHYSVTDFRINQDNIFLRDGEFQESGMIENMAQTAAAGAGYYGIRNNIQLPLTYIVTISQLKINEYPVEGDLIRTRTELVSSVLNIGVIRGYCYCDERLMAECEMKLITDHKQPEV